MLPRFVAGLLALGLAPVALPQRVVCSLETTGPWFAALQHEDGHWDDHSAGPERAPPIPEGGTAPSVELGPLRPDQALRTTSMVLLALLADGSTMRRGPNRSPIRLGTKWLRERIDAQGRFALSTDAAWIGDHALATLAFAEVTRLSESRLLLEQVVRSVDFLAEHLAHPRVSSSPELVAWSEATVESLDAFGPRDDDGAIAACRDRLRTALVRHRAQMRSPRTDLEHAIALHLAAGAAAREAAREATNATERRAAVEAFAAACASALERWPDPGELDPLATLLATSALYRAGGAEWQAWSLRLRDSVVAAQEPAGHWPTRHGARGLVQTAALHGATLCCYYRHSALRMAR